MLLMGFYILGTGALIAVLGLDALMVIYGNSFLPLVVGVPITAGAFFLVGRAFQASLSMPDPKIAGVAVSEAEQPALWSAVREAAAAAGTAPPGSLWIDSDLNAAVFEQSRWLGLRSGPQHLVIGAPLLVAFSPTRLDAVLAHEFGHFAHRDTRLLPVIMRGRSGLARAVNTAGFFTTGSVSNGRWMLGLQMAIVRLIHAYAVRYLTATQKISRAQEYAADRISAELCGRDTAACVLAELSAYQRAYRYFRDRFADAGAGLGLVPLPETLFAGFGHVLNQPRWQRAVESERRSPSPERTSAFDSHPPTTERVAALRALPDDGRALDTSASRAVDLIEDAEALFAAVARSAADDVEKKEVDWDTLADAVARARARQATQPLANALFLIKAAPPVLADFFDQVEAGRLETVLYRLLTPAQARFAGFGSVGLEIGARTLAPALRAWVVAELAEAGVVRWKNSWSEVAVLDVEEGEVRKDVDEALTALLSAEPADAGPPAAALRGVLKNAGVPV
jgi:Zn-dependent protease with chaperone function